MIWVGHTNKPLVQNMFAVYIHIGCHKSQNGTNLENREDSITSV